MMLFSLVHVAILNKDFSYWVSVLLLQSMGRNWGGKWFQMTTAIENWRKRYLILKRTVLFCLTLSKQRSVRKRQTESGTWHLFKLLSTISVNKSIKHHELIRFSVYFKWVLLSNLLIKIINSDLLQD